MSNQSIAGLLCEDVLASIFAFAAKGHAQLCANAAPLSLLWVCSRWRRVARSNESLWWWTTLHIPGDGLNPTLYAMIPSIRRLVLQGGLRVVYPSPAQATPCPLQHYGPNITHLALHRYPQNTLASLCEDSFPVLRQLVIDMLRISLVEAASDPESIERPIRAFFKSPLERLLIRGSANITLQRPTLVTHLHMDNSMLSSDFVRPFDGTQHLSINRYRNVMSFPLVTSLILGCTLGHVLPLPHEQLQQLQALSIVQASRALALFQHCTQLTRLAIGVDYTMDRADLQAIAIATPYLAVLQIGHSKLGYLASTLDTGRWEGLRELIVQTPHHNFLRRDLIRDGEASDVDFCLIRTIMGLRPDARVTSNSSIQPSVKAYFEGCQLGVSLPSYFVEEHAGWRGRYAPGTW